MQLITACFRCVLGVLKQVFTSPDFTHTNHSADPGQSLTHSSGTNPANGTKDTGLMGSLADVLKKRLCDLLWEIRDSTVEFVASVMTAFKGLHY